MPTVQGDLTVEIQQPGNVECGGPPSCAQSPLDPVYRPDGGLSYPWVGDPTVVYVSPQATRWDFYMELGHQFDWTILTPNARARFTRLMGGGLPWWDSATVLDYGTEDGMEGLFAADYADCAAGRPADSGACALIDEDGGWPGPFASREA